MNLCNEDDLKNAFLDFCQTISELRDEKTGCPWDLKQDHQSLRRYMIEEAYEAAEAMGGTDTSALCEELGDVLLQVVLNAQVAFDRGDFSIVEVIRSINEKMRERHPHVFESGSDIKTPEQVRVQWDEIKGKRKKKSDSVFEPARKVQPALKQAEKIGKIAKEIQFDWQSPAQVFAHVESELAELREAVKAKVGIENEMGDVFFTLTQLCRHLDLDPEVTVQRGNLKFLRRFAKVEELAKLQGQPLADCDLELLWSKAKENGY